MNSKTCPHCGTQFTHPKRTYCTRSCAASVTTKMRGQEPWSETEDDLLRSLHGAKQAFQVIRDWNDEAKARGWGERTKNAIKVRFTKLCYGATVRTSQDNWTGQDLSKLLDIPVDRIQRWILLGLKVDKDKGAANGHHAIARLNLKAFAKTRPDLFWGIDPKKLSKVLKDPALTKNITSIVTQPTVGRSITVICLHSGDVYESAKATARALNVHPKLVRDVARRDTPALSGMDFYQLDYPVYWVPMAVRKEFSHLAGKILYDIYLELVNVDGYKKQSCLIVASRIAVQITLITFRRQLKEKALGIEITSKEAIAAYWKEKFMGYLSEFRGLTERQQFRKTLDRIKACVYKVFVQMLPGCSHKRLQIYLEEYALWYSEKAGKYFQQKSFIPKNYRPRTNLELQDYYAHIYASVTAYIPIGESYRWLVVVNAWKYIKKYIWNRNPDWQYPLLPSGDDFSTQIKALNATVDTQIERPDEIQELLDYIESKVASDEYDTFRTYIDLKLEDCSDTEIATVLEINEQDVVNIMLKLQKYAARVTA